MGLLDSLRKRTADTKDDAEAASADADEVADVVESIISGPSDQVAANDDAWLSGVERRRPEPEAPDQAAAILEDPALQYPSIQQGVPAVAESDFEPIADATVADATVADQAEEPELSPNEAFLAQGTSPTLQAQQTFPSMGMVYAGLEEAGIAAFPSEQPAPAPDLTPTADFLAVQTSTADYPSIEDGPIGAESVAHLAVLNLAVGCSWDDVTTARRTILAGLTSGTAEEWHQRVEINHAFASLRLLRVGPLQG